LTGSGHQGSTVSVKVRAICGPTEAEEKIRQAILRALGLTRKPSFTVHRLTGVFGEPITVLETELAGMDAEAALRRLEESLPSSYLEAGTESAGRVKTIHVRLNKQFAFLGVIQPVSEDAIKIEIRIRKEY
jgi:RNA binding exosome subunit